MELTDLVTAFAAVAALFISVNQMRLSNQQKLFDRRLKYGFWSSGSLQHMKRTVI